MVRPTSRLWGRMRRRMAVVGVVSLVCATAVVGVPGPPAAVAVEADGVDWGELGTGTSTSLVGPADDALAFTLYLNLVPATDPVPVALAVSDPRSLAYGEHLTLDEAVATHGAGGDTLDAVRAAVDGVGGSVSFGPTNTFARAELTVAGAAELLSVSFGEFRVDSADNASFYCNIAGVGGSCIAPLVGEEPSLPASLVGRVDAAFGLVFPVPTAALPSSVGPPVGPVGPAEFGDVGVEPAAGDTPATPFRTGTPEGCAEALDAVSMDGPDGVRLGLAPNQLATAYGYDQLATAGLTGAGVRLAVLEYGGNVVPGDLEAHAECFGYPVPDLRQVNVPGGVAPPPGSSWVEATLDAQVVAQIAPDLEAFDLYSYNGSPATELPWVLEMLALPLTPEVYGEAPPDIVSVSYGECEPLFAEEATSLVAIVERMLAVSATTPMTFLVAAGDTGSSGCARNGIPSIVGPAFPSTSAWVLAVGGTALTLDADNRLVDEAVWNDTLYPAPYSNQQAGGGGGASGVVLRPEWQTGEGVTPGDERLVPDVASFADVFPGWIIYCTGDCSAGPDSFGSGFLPIGGTSAATPQVAGILALARQAGAAAGQPAFGFANPLVYELARAGSDALRDVTVVNNDVHDVGCCDASAGFDIASGWGSVRAERLVAALVNPTARLEARSAPPATGTATGTGTGTAKVMLDASGSTAPVGAPVAYEWDTNGDGVVDEITTTPTLEVAAPPAGVAVTMAVTVRALTGREATASTVWVSAVAPRFTG